MSDIVIRLAALARPTARGRGDRYIEAARVADLRIRDVARALDVPQGVIRSGRRSPNRKALLARQIVVYTLHRFEGLSYPEIARALGLANHTSAIHLYRTAERDYASSTTLEPRRTEDTPGTPELEVESSPSSRDTVDTPCRKAA